MTTPAQEADAFDVKIKSAMQSIQSALKPNDEDPDKVSLIDAIQAHRAIILDIASQAYVQKRNDPKLLEALSSLISQLEKSIRDDRKEKAKKIESEDNRAGFKQIVEALSSLSSGNIELPTFDSYILPFDPLGDDIEAFEVKPGELTMGIINLDFEGAEV